MARSQTAKIARYVQIGLQHLRQPAGCLHREARHRPIERRPGPSRIVNAKRIWQMNRDFWAQHHLPLKQEMIFASTGTKKPTDPPTKYVEAFAGSDIETNPPATNEAVQTSGHTFSRQVDKLP